jgi:hypothetical protein
VALVEITERAERSLLEIFGKTNKRLDTTCIVVDLHERDAQLAVKTSDDLGQLQSDIDLVGPFRVPIGSEIVRLFVREPAASTGNRYELDYYSYGGRGSFQIRERLRAD